MKHIKLFEAFSTPTLTEEQISWLNKCTRKGWKLNPSTGLVDVDRNFKCEKQILTDFKGVRFGHVKENFTCSFNQLTSLEGAPQTVDGSFNCGGNQLTSLEGAPKTVGGSFYCNGNQLTSLNGAPKTIGKDFSCGVNKLTSLEGAPQTVDESFDCGGNQLTSLEGAPKTIGKYFNCSDNQLTSLNGAPLNVGKNFFCGDNQLTSLDGAPQTVGGNFDCGSNQLTSLVGATKTVGGSFGCDNNPLKSLEGAPERVGSFIISTRYSDNDPAIRTLDWKKGWSKKGNKRFMETLASKLKEINALGSGADKGKLTSMLLSLTEESEILKYLLSLGLSTSDKFGIYGAIKDNIPDVWDKIKDEVDPDGVTSDLIDLGF